MPNDMTEVEMAKSFEVLNRGFEEFKSTYDARMVEVEKKGASDVLLTEKVDRIEADLQKAQKATDEAVLSLKRQSRVVTTPEGEVIDLDEKAVDWAKGIATFTGKHREVEGFDAKALTEYKAAFRKLVKSNFNHDALLDSEKKTLSVGNDADGGYWVHPDMSGAMVKKVYETSPVRAYASVVTITKDAIEGYYDNDEVGYGWVTELEARAATGTPQIGKWRIPVHEMYALPEASQTMLDDSEVNVEAWLTGKIADKFARVENTAFISGTGVGQPYGFLSYPESSDLTVGVARTVSGGSGAFASAPAGADCLITAMHALKTTYRANFNWFMNRSTEGVVRTLKDSEGVYLWRPGIELGKPNSLLGYPVAPFEDMPDIASGSLSIALGDLRAAYQIVDRMGVRLLRDPYSAKPKVQFYATKRTGGGLINGEAIRFIEFSTS